MPDLGLRTGFGDDDRAVTDTVVHLIRHGQVYNPEDIRYGQLAGFRLSSRGCQQARAAASYLQSLGRPIASIVSSPLQRATETAKIIGDALALPFVTDQRLIESATQFDGLPRLAMLSPKLWPKLWNPFRPSWGESFDSIASRMRAAIDEALAAHAGSSIVFVSHQAPIWITRHSYEASGPPWLSRVRCTQASVTSLLFTGKQFDRSTYWAPTTLRPLVR
ncbi:MAG: Phosphoglycerate mutase [Myxococcales bacterium]|nr:Phosphoglycerate mutase [Myxococcales bacterium]